VIEDEVLLWFISRSLWDVVLNQIEECTNDSLIDCLVNFVFAALNNFSVLWWRSVFIGGRENRDILIIVLVIFAKYMYMYINFKPDFLLPVKGCWIWAYAHNIRPVGREWSLSSHICSDTGFGFFLFHEIYFYKLP
jgi:hypothetical protein